MSYGPSFNGQCCVYEKTQLPLKCFICIWQLIECDFFVYFRWWIYPAQSRLRSILWKSSCVSIATWKMLWPHSSAVQITSVSRNTSKRCNSSYGGLVCKLCANCVCVCFSPSDTIQKVMMKQFDVVEGAETRLWMKSSDTCCERLRNVHVNVLDSCLISGMVCLLSLSDPHPTLPHTYLLASLCCFLRYSDGVFKWQLCCNMSCLHCRRWSWRWGMQMVPGPAPDRRSCGGSFFLFIISV